MTMNKTEFMRMMKDNQGAVEMLQEILRLAKTEGYQDGFDAGFRAGCEGDMLSGME